MRVALENLEIPVATRTRLPAVLQEDKFILDLVDSLDDVLAPIYLVLDCIEAYFDPYLTPEDFLEWMSYWVAVELDETWDDARRRELVASALSLYRKRGTLAGLADYVRIYAGVDPILEDSGGVTYSTTAKSAARPGSDSPFLRVRLEVGKDSKVSEDRIKTIVDKGRPAHVRSIVELVKR